MSILYPGISLTCLLMALVTCSGIVPFSFGVFHLVFWSLTCFQCPLPCQHFAGISLQTPVYECLRKWIFGRVFKKFRNTKFHSFGNFTKISNFLREILRNVVLRNFVTTLLFGIPGDSRTFNEVHTVLLCSAELFNDVTITILINHFAMIFYLASLFDI
jgi:hypothetical protein